MYSTEDEVEGEIARVFAQKHSALEACMRRHRSDVDDTREKLHRIFHESIETSTNDAADDEVISDSDVDRFALEIMRISRRAENTEELTKHILSAFGQPHLCSPRELWELADTHLFSAENVATLMEPMPRCRPDAVRFVKGIYDRRSRAVHGDELSGNELFRDRARFLANHVLRAVMERRDFEAKIGARATSSDQDTLLKELEAARLTGQQFVGVVPSEFARSLWSAGAGSTQ